MRSQTCSGFLYYLPAGLGHGAAAIAAASGGMLEMAGLVVRADADGPDQGRGTLAAQGGEVADLAHDAAGQDWIAPLDGCGCWVGLAKDGRPAPAELARPVMTRGWPVVLADGNEWSVPVVYDAAGQLALPRRLGMRADGALVLTSSQAQDAAAAVVHALRMRLLAAVDDAAGAELDLSQSLDAAAAALGLHYRLGRRELCLAGLLTAGPGGNMQQVLAAAIDLPAVFAWQKAQK